MTTSIRIFLLCITLCVVQWGHSKDTPPSYTLIIFEGSDWCGNCRRLEHKVLTDSQFQAYMTQADIQIEKIDFPQRKQLSESQQSYNASVAEKYKFSGAFPTLILVNNTTTNYYTLTYANESVDQMIAKIKSEISTSE